jgi:hypothetical protein
MKPWLLLLLVCGIDAYALDPEWVTVGDAGNAPDKKGHGVPVPDHQA